jgi:hypothetical protein
MYCIRASDGLEAAIIEKEDGTIHFSLGPNRIMYGLLEKDAQPIDEEQLEILIEDDDFIKHTPPTVVKNFEDWPEAVTAYEAKAKQLVSSAAD